MLKVSIKEGYQPMTISFIISNLTMDIPFMHNVNFKIYICFAKKPKPSWEAFRGDFYKIRKIDSFNNLWRPTWVNPSFHQHKKFHAFGNMTWELKKCPFHKCFFFPFKSWRTNQFSSVGADNRSYQVDFVSDQWKDFDQLVTDQRIYEIGQRIINPNSTFYKRACYPFNKCVILDHFRVNLLDSNNSLKKKEKCHIWHI